MLKKQEIAKIFNNCFEMMFLCRVAVKHDSRQVGCDYQKSGYTGGSGALAV